MSNEEDDYNFDDVATTVGSVRMIDDASSSLSSGTRTIGTRHFGSGGARTVHSRSLSRAGTRGGRRQVGGRSTAGERSVRPMTAASRAGYSSTSRSGSGEDDATTVFRPNTAASATTASFDSSATTGPNVVRNPEEVAKEMETVVHHLIEESALLLQSGELLGGLDAAKKAGKKERELAKHRDSHSLIVEDGNDLTFSVWFQLATAYEKNAMHDEAIKSYSFLSRQKKFRSSSKALVNVNLGNILYQQQKYAEAVKSYQMALDQIPPEERQVGFKVCRNVGNAMIKLGKYRDAAQSFQTAMSTTVPDFESAFNLLLCQIAKGDDERAKQVFVKMLTLPLSSVGDYGTGAGSVRTGGEEQKETGGDDLNIELKRRRKVAGDILVNAARLVAPIVATGKDWATGFQWVIEKVNEAELGNLGCILEMELAVQHLRKRNIDEAVKILKEFEQKDQDYRAVASTNISFLYLLEGNIDEAMDQASLAVTTNRYNAKALVNLGCSFYSRQDFGKAKDCFLEAIGVEAGCVQALYNLGLVNVELRDYDGAVQAFERVLQLAPSNLDALYWLSRIGPEHFSVIFESLQY